MQPAPIQKKTVILLLALSVLVSLLSVPFVFWNTIHSSKVTLPADYPTSDEITVVGLCTDICVISNAMLLKAFLPEAKICVDADCCAGVTPESHSRALEAMKMCHIDVL